MSSSCKPAAVVSCVFLGFWAALVSPSQAADLLLNQGFEGGFDSTSYGPVGTHWEPCGRPELSGSSLYSYNSATGFGYYQRMTPAAAGDEVGVCQHVTGLTPGRMVRFSAQVYQKVSNCTIWMAIDPDNNLPPEALPARTTQVPYTSGQWTTWEISERVGTGGEVAVYVWNYCESGTPQYINLNDTSLSYSSAVVSDLAAVSSLSDAVQLQWTAPAGAAQYEIRYAQEPVTDLNWASATVVSAQVPPSPMASGTVQTSWVRGLAANTAYYFGIKFKLSGGTWSDTSNSPSRTTAVQGSAPYWAQQTRDKLAAWYSTMLSDCQTADDNSGSTAKEPDNLLHWYFGGWDGDCEQQPRIGSLLSIVRDPWMLGFLGRLSDHVWSVTFTNTPPDKDHYNATRELIPMWNESHHAGECSWNGVALVALDYDNSKWVDRLVQYAAYVHKWTGYTGDPPHLHFKTFWVKKGNWDYSSVRGLASLVQNPEDSRFTRALWYASWHDPSVQMPDGQTIKDFLYELNTAMAADAMKTDLGKPVGFIPGEIRFDTHAIGGYSGSWWRMAGGIGGTPGVDERFWDWRYGFVQSRDAYFDAIDQYLTSGDPECLATVRETIRYFNQTVAINSIPPIYLFEPPQAPWPDRNDPWGGYLYWIALLYQHATGDTQFDSAWLAHANLLWQIMPPPGAQRYQCVWRSTLTWDTSTPLDSATAVGPFFMAWRTTGDKEWLCRALDEMAVGGMEQLVCTEAMYTGSVSMAISRLPDQPITWNNTTNFTDFAALVLESDHQHIRWLTYNFSAADKTMPIWLWTLEPGDYVLRHGPDANLDDQMDSVTESIPFTYQQRRTSLTITLPANRMEVFEIVSAGPPTAPGDFDRDGDVDQKDFGHLQGCFTEPGVPPDDPNCSDARLDADSDVDSDDFALFQACFSGANVPADPDCGP
jgi:hypothetical protein